MAPLPLICCSSTVPVPHGLNLRRTYNIGLKTPHITRGST